MPKYKTVFDKVMLNQLRRLGKNKNLRAALSLMLDRIEEKGEKAGKLVDSQLFIYEVKSKKPSLRLYFKPVADSKRIYVFEYEMKKGNKKQKATLRRIKDKVMKFLERLKT
ncbi:MAG: hypothetical protein R6U32_02315 [Candidatus Woesearchaeota archaeon]